MYGDLYRVLKKSRPFDPVTPLLITVRNSHEDLGTVLYIMMLAKMVQNGDNLGVRQFANGNKYTVVHPCESRTKPLKIIVKEFY